jgi:hypothetical protein
MTCEVFKLLDMALGGLARLVKIYKDGSSCISLLREVVDETRDETGSQTFRSTIACSKLY